MKDSIPTPLISPAIFCTIDPETTVVPCIQNATALMHPSKMLQHVFFNIFSYLIIKFFCIAYTLFRYKNNFVAYL